MRYKNVYNVYNVNNGDDDFFYNGNNVYNVYFWVKVISILLGPGCGAC